MARLAHITRATDYDEMIDAVQQSHYDWFCFQTNTNSITLGKEEALVRLRYERDRYCYAKMRSSRTSAYK